MTDATIVQSDEDEAVAPQVANSPFDDQNADLILRASDNVDFYVHKILLSLVSPFFQDMFSLPQSPNRKAGEVKKDGDREFPVAAAPENSPVLAGLLVWVDPRCNPVLGTMDDLGDVLQAADKYLMASVVVRIGSALKQSKHVEADPLRVFAIAYRHKELEGMKDLFKQAARETVKLTVPFKNPPVDELKTITGDAVQRLYEYHAAYGKMPPTLHGKAVSGSTATCKAEDRGHGEGLEWSSISVWWLDYMRAAAEALRKRPAGTTVLTLEAKEILLKAQACKQAPLVSFTQFQTRFVAEVEKVVDTVQFKIDQ